MTCPKCNDNERLIVRRMMVIDFIISIDEEGKHCIEDSDVKGDPKDGRITEVECPDCGHTGTPEQFGMEVEHITDPTMLLRKELEKSKRAEVKEALENGWEVPTFDKKKEQLREYIENDSGSAQDFARKVIFADILTVHQLVKLLIESIEYEAVDFMYSLRAKEK